MPRFQFWEPITYASRGRRSCALALEYNALLRELVGEIQLGLSYGGTPILARYERYKSHGEGTSRVRVLQGFQTSFRDDLVHGRARREICTVVRFLLRGSEETAPSPADSP